MFEFELPDVGEGVSEGELVAWHVEVGDRVEEDDVLAEVETDKAVVELPAPRTGTVQELHAAAGDVVPVGEVVVTIAEDGDEPADADGTDAAAPKAGDDAEPAAATSGDADGTGDGRVFAAPRVRRLAREEGVDIESVAGSGPGGRVTEGDVRAAAGEDHADPGVGEAEPSPEPAAATAGDDGAAAPSGNGTAAAAARERTLAVPATRALAEELGVDLDRVPTERTRDGEPFVAPADVRAFAEGAQAAETTETAEPGTADAAGAKGAAAGVDEATEAGADGVRREPYRGVRRTIGERMAAADEAVPRATHHDTVVVTDLVETRERLAERAAERDVRLTYLPFVLKAVAAGVEAHPVINSHLDEEAEEVVYHDAVHAGVATATDDGLLVPVVEDVGSKGLLELAETVNDLVERARARKLAPAEMQGGTLSVTNFGAIGGEYATPIVNHPETAILGLGAIEQRAVVEDGEAVAQPTLPLSLAIDHRVIDGADAAGFVNTVMAHLRDPSLLLL